MTRDCRHRDTEIVYTELRGAEKEVVAHCSDCEALLTARIDFRYEDAHVLVEND